MVSLVWILIPITNLQCTCGDVTSYRYNSRFKDVWIPCAGCASAKKLQCFTAACRAVGGRSWLFGGYLLILIGGRCLGFDPILFIRLSMAHIWHVVWWNKVSLVWSFVDSVLKYITRGSNFDILWRHITARYPLFWTNEIKPHKTGVVGP